MLKIKFAFYFDHRHTGLTADSDYIYYCIKKNKPLKVTSISVKNIQRSSVETFWASELLRLLDNSLMSKAKKEVE